MSWNQLETVWNRLMHETAKHDKDLQTHWSTRLVYQSRRSTGFPSPSRHPPNIKSCCWLSDLGNMRLPYNKVPKKKLIENIRFPVESHVAISAIRKHGEPSQAGTSLHHLPQAVDRGLAVKPKPDPEWSRFQNHPKSSKIIQNHPNHWNMLMMLLFSSLNHVVRTTFSTLKNMYLNDQLASPSPLPWLLPACCCARQGNRRDPDPPTAPWPVQHW